MVELDKNKTNYEMFAVGRPIEGFRSRDNSIKNQFSTELINFPMKIHLGKIEKENQNMNQFVDLTGKLNMFSAWYALNSRFSWQPSVKI